MAKKETMKELLDGAATEAIREAMDEVFGANCAFVDDDAAVLAILAKRAIEAGLAKDVSPEFMRRYVAKHGEPPE